MKPIDKNLDSAWSELIKLRAGGICEKCGSRLRLSSHHIYTRGGMMLRWDLKNGICLCYSHHVESSEFSAHGTPEKFMDWLKEKRGEEFVEDLEFKSHQILKLHEFEKKELLKEIKSEIKRLRA